MIERVAGTQLNEALRTLLFQPLGIDGVFVALTPQ
jgi:CubicO group peptidase (beta-lactamase class C family)